MLRRILFTTTRLGLLVSPVFIAGQGVAVLLRDVGLLRSRPSHSRGFHGLAALGLVCLMAFSATAADAEVVVEGDRDQMQVTVDSDSVDQVLEALGQKENLHYRSTAPLNKVIDGSFSGSLGHVLSRILVGFDFVVRYNPQGIEIFVYEESGETPVPPQALVVDSPRPRPPSRVPGRAAVGPNVGPRPVVPHTASH
jgi:hypothetical protein